MSEHEHAVFRYRYPTVEIDEPIARDAFQASSARATEKILAELDATLRRAQLTAADVEVVCCTGGTARLPAVEAALAARFGANKLNQFQHFHSVIRGLSEHARDSLH